MSAEAALPPRRRSRALRVACAVLVLSFAALELAARALTRASANGMPRVGKVALLPFLPSREIVERCLDRNAPSNYVVRDPELGWTIGPDGESAGLYRSNAEGVRADPARVYGAKAPPGKLRIVTVGDSFTHGDEVEASATWQSRLEAQDGELEVLNLGVPGYGTDQALMRWRRDGRRFEGRIVILGIWPENMCRNLSLLRYYLVPAESFACKPRMLLEGGELRVIGSPVLGREELIATLTDPGSRTLLEHDHWYRAEDSRPKAFEALRVLRVAESLCVAHSRREERMRIYAGEEPAGIEITVGIARSFFREVRAAGATPIVLVIPMRDLLAMQEVKGEFPLVRALRDAEVEVIDLGPRMAEVVKERGEGAVYLPSGHLSVEGNRVLAEGLLAELRPWLGGVRGGR